MEQMSNMNEMVSALADGELQGEAFGAAMDVLADEGDARESWHAYHLVGDVLRSAELASTSNGSDFVARLRVRLQQEQVMAVSRVASLPVHDEIEMQGATTRVAADRAPANAPGFGWPLLAGVASLAAVAAIAWNVLGGTGGVPASAELAQAGVAPVQMARNEPATAVMIRDARLDELLAAHRQAGGATALQMPAGFLRNATFESPGR